jgi:hypothetical protein
MKQPPHPKVLTFALALIAGAACTPKKDTANPDDDGQKACTDDAKVCPDGSSVARSGPDCEFAACPGDAATPEPEGTAPEGDAPEGGPEGSPEPAPAGDGE